jgi:hypothetical protein
MLRRFFLWLFPEADREAELNVEILRMSRFVTKHYTPKQRVTFLNDIRANILADLERERDEHLEAYNERTAAIEQINTTGL